MQKRSIYFLSGIAVLIVSAIVLTVLDETQETQDIVSQTKNDAEIKLTGTPADKYPPTKQEQHCGKTGALSNTYIKEYEIPTPCTQPLSIVTDPDGRAWFVQTNTGNVAMFDPSTESFIEYQNDRWDAKRVSMVWGIAYTEDDEIWFTDEATDSIWKFSISEEKYSKFGFPGNVGKSFPQKIRYHDGNFVINDFTGNRVVIVNHKSLDDNEVSYSSITIPEGFYTSQASTDKDGNVWFVMWKYQNGAILVRADSKTHETEQFSLPSNISAPNGVSIGPAGNVWIADTGSSSFYSFNPEDEQVIEYVTSDPPVWSFGNSTGLIKTPITRPYWNSFDSNGNMWFNQQTANRLAMFDPISETLLEYDIPSKNSNWADCGDMQDCGISQNFGFAFNEDKIWFTEWAENNIGILDTSIDIPITINAKQDEIKLKNGDEKELFVTIRPITDEKITVTLSANTNSELIDAYTSSEPITIENKEVQIPFTVKVGNATSGLYKILITSQLQDVSVSSYVSIKII